MTKGKDAKAPPEDPELEELIRRAQRGDRAAQDRLFDRYRARLHLQAERRLGQRPALGMNASDVVQETLLKAYNHIGEMERSSRPELEGWLQRILRNTIVESWRGLTRQKRDGHKAVSLSDPDLPEIAAAQRSPSQAVARGQEWLQVLRAMTKLPDGQREAVWLRHVEELSLKEIAARMDRTELAAASLIRRGLEQLRQELGQAPQVPARAGAAAEAQLDEAVAAYLGQGGAVASAEFLAGYRGPCAEQLRAYLEGAEQVQELAAQSKARR